MAHPTATQHALHIMYNIWHDPSSYRLRAQLTHSTIHIVFFPNLFFFLSLGTALRDVRVPIIPTGYVSVLKSFHEITFGYLRNFCVRYYYGYKWIFRNNVLSPFTMETCMHVDHTEFHSIAIFSPFLPIYACVCVLYMLPPSRLSIYSCSCHIELLIHKDPSIICPVSIFLPHHFTLEIYSALQILRNVMKWAHRQHLSS